MDKYYPIIVQGVFLIVYLIVFVIQKSQIDTLKSNHASMKTFIDIFKIDEVKKYVELMGENMKMKAINIIRDEGKLNDKIKEVIKEQEPYIANIKSEQTKEELIELLEFSLHVLKDQPEEDRNNILNQNLPKTKRYFEDKF